MTATATGPRLSPIDVVLTRLAKRTAKEPVAGKSAGTWVADCPIDHAGSIESLEIRIASDGRIGLTCVLGCAPRAIAASLDLKLADLFPQTQSQNGTASADESEPLPPAVRAIDAREPDPITWAVEELLIAAELAVFAGDGGSFKTTSALHMAAAVAGGYSVFNRFPTRQAPALILSAEDGEGVIRNRLEAIVVGHGWDRERVLSNVYIIATHDAKLSNPEWQQHLLDECARLSIGFTLFDPWADLISGEENSNSEQRPIIQFCRKVATQTLGPVVVNAHVTKTREGQRALDKVRGATALRDAARCVLLFEDRPEGIAVEHLKMSRSEKLPPFTITREIESAPESRAIWSSARFTFQTAEEAVLSRVESFLLDQIIAAPGTLKSGDLRHAAGKEGIRGEDVAKGLSHLQARNLIDFIPGSRNSKLWCPIGYERPQEETPARVSDPVQEFWSGSGRLDSEPDHPARSHSGRLPAPSPTLSQPASPFRGTRQAGGSEGPGQGGLTRFEDRDDDLEVVELDEELDR